MYPLNYNSQFPTPSDPASHHSSFCLYEPDYPISCKWNHTKFVLMSLISLSRSFRGHTHYSMYQSFTHFQSCRIVHCMYIPYFVYSLMHRWTFGLFLPFGYCEGCCYEHWCTNTCSSPQFQFFVYITRCRIAGLYGNSVCFFEELLHCFSQKLYHFNSH